MLFANRLEAGKKLAERLKFFKDNFVVMALPRGGVPVGFEVAKYLNLPLSVVVARKIGVPSNPEFGVGAISEEDVCILEEAVINLLKINPKNLEKIINKEKDELKRRVEEYRDKEPLAYEVSGRNVILVDDGLATGVTATAAVESLYKGGAKKIIFASPICANDSSKVLQNIVEKIVCLTVSEQLVSVGRWYQNFSQVSDIEVKKYLKKAKNFGKIISPRMDNPRINGVP